MNYLLDTNILINLADGGTWLTKEVASIIEDESNGLYASVRSASELPTLLRGNKLSINSYNELIKRMSLLVTWTPVTLDTVNEYASLNIDWKLNKDSNDFIIVSQAIISNMTLISTEKRLGVFQEQGLKFLYNPKSNR